MKKGLSCREAFTNELTRLGRINQDIVALTSDAKGSTSLNVFADALPGQFIEIGIAEQNEIGMAAGLAAVGKRPYVCAPASFLSARSLEQIKVDIAYSRTNVKMLAVSGGISYGALGFSHHSTHDIAVFRAIPGIHVVLPCDEAQTVGLLQALEAADFPAYVRVGKAAMPVVYEEGTKFEIGKAVTLRDGGDVAIIACGEMVWPALQAADQLAADGIRARVVDMHTLQPFDRDAVLEAARTGAIVTVEEHSIHGGLGAAVAEIVVQTNPAPMKILGLPHETIVAGPSPDVFAHYGLDATGIGQAARDLISKAKK